MIVPPPSPSYTLAPDVDPLCSRQQAALLACLSTLTGRISGVVVTAAVTTQTHIVIELMTAAGTLLLLERVAPPEPPVLSDVSRP